MRPAVARIAMVGLLVLVACEGWFPGRDDACRDEFANGIGFHSDDDCHLVACKDGFGDRDGNPENGCECEKSNAGVEICDGADNDCDGVVDRLLDIPGYVSICNCMDDDLAAGLDPTTVVPDVNTLRPDCRTSRCELDEINQSLHMDFCCDDNAAWSQCRVGHVDLSRFDADTENQDGGAGEGALEIVVDLSEQISGVGINIWYGDFPRRKLLAFIRPDEEIGPGRVTRYFVPEDAQCPDYRDDDFTAADIPPACQVESCPAGRWSQFGSECAFDYSQSQIYLAAEFCSQSVSATVTLVSVTYFPDLNQCLCAETGCQAGRTCATSASIPAPWCSEDNPRCAGLCVQEKGQTGDSESL